MKKDVKQTALDYALSYACRAGNYEVAEYALGLGADVNYGRGFTLSPLHGALYWCREDDQSERLRIVMLLLQAGANPNVLDRERCTPLYDAVRRNIPAAVSLLLGWGADTADIDGTGRSLLKVARDLAKWKILKMLEQGELALVIQ